MIYAFIAEQCADFPGLDSMSGAEGVNLGLLSTPQPTGHRPRACGGVRGEPGPHDLETVPEGL